MLNYLKYFFFTFLLIAVCGAGVLFALFNNTWIDFAPLEHYQPGKPTILLDDHGNEWARFARDKRTPINIDHVPQHVIDAFVAAEDWHFFSHHGISIKGILRSIVVNVYHRRRAQGASTITQQLVKLLFFDIKKTFTRKLKEQLYALVVERQFTKKQILQAYLNHIYFGCGIYGIEAACQRFWHKSASEISIDEAAILAATVKSPGLYCPLLCPLSCEQRRNIVLHSMFKCGFISHDEYAQAKEQPLCIADKDTSRCAPHLKESIRQFLEQLVGSEQLYRGGLIVQTTINSAIQKKAQQEFKKQCIHLREKMNPDIEGGLITIETQTGQIKALVGGYDFAQSKFNRVMQARRQIGSTIKPIIYTAALQEGKNFFDTVLDEPFELNQNGQIWRPKNYNRRFNGEITRAYAISHSNNIATIKTFLDIDAQRVIDLLKKCRITAPLHTYPSLALGTIDTTLYEVVTMFNVFANNGVCVEPYFIRWVKNSMGKKIYKKIPAQERVLNSRVVSQVAQVLTHGINRVQKIYPNEWIDSDAISKTGTTNDSRTCWFVGSTPELTTAVYIGCDDNRSLGDRVYPFHTALPIWRHLHRSITTTQKHFIFDSSLREFTMHEKTGLPAQKGDVGAVTILI